MVDMNLAFIDYEKAFDIVKSYFSQCTAKEYIPNDSVQVIINTRMYKKISNYKIKT
jgi:hypothetical protein